MDRDSLLGCIIVVVALISITYLVFWSRNTIERIARKRLSSVREILEDLHDG